MPGGHSRPPEVRPKARAGMSKPLSPPEKGGKDRTGIGPCVRVRYRINRYTPEFLVNYVMKELGQ